MKMATTTSFNGSLEPKMPTPSTSTGHLEALEVEEESSNTNLGGLLEENTAFQLDLDDALQEKHSATTTLDGPIEEESFTTYRLEGPLAEFHLFPKLPIELRLKIWGFAVPAPRIITQQKSKYPKKTCNRVPAILRVCRESRNEYLTDKNSPLRKRNHPTYTLVHVKYAVYFSYEIDTLYVVSHSSDFACEGFFDLTMIMKLRYLAFDQVNAIRPILDALTPLLTADPSAMSLRVLTTVLHTTTYDGHMAAGHIKFKPGGLNEVPKFSAKIVTDETKAWYANYVYRPGITLVPNLAIEHRGRFRDRF